MAQQPQPFDEKKFFSDKGYPLNIRTKPDKQQEIYCCGICGGLAREAVEVSCDIHLKDPDFNPTPYCEGNHAQTAGRTYFFTPVTSFNTDCLKAHLKKTGKQCPIGEHRCTYQPSLFVRRSVRKITVKCPRETQQSEGKEESIMNRTEGCQWTGPISGLIVLFPSFLPFPPSFSLL